MYSVPSYIISISGHTHHHAEMSFRTYYRGNKAVVQRYAIINPFRGKYSAAVISVRKRLTEANVYAREDYAVPSRRRRWEAVMRIHNVAAKKLRNALGLTVWQLNKHNDPTHELRDYNMLYYYITAFYSRALARMEREGCRMPVRLMVERMLSEILTDYQPIIKRLSPYLPPVEPSDGWIFSVSPFLAFLSLRRVYI